MVIRKKGGEIPPRFLPFPQRVLGHAGVIQRHVVVGPVMHDQLHDRTGCAITAGIRNRMRFVEHDPYCPVAIGLPQSVDDGTGGIELARQCLAWRTVALTFGRSRRGKDAMRELDLDWITPRAHALTPSLFRHLATRGSMDGLREADRVALVTKHE